MLAAGVAAQASYLAFVTGLAVLAPALRDDLGLSLTEVGVVIAAPWVGPIATLLPWGIAADRVGERPVLAAGVGAGGLLVVAAAFVEGFWPLVVLLGLAGAAGGSANAASGRAVMSWFGAEERGLALGIRQASTPLGGLIAALGLPPLERAGGLEAAFLALGAFGVAAAAACLAAVRDGAGDEVAEAAPRVLRDARLWRIGAAAGCYITTQVALTGFLVLFLHDERGVSLGRAAALLAAVQVAAVVLRVAAGRWSDVAGARIAPLRRIGLAMVAATAVSAALLDAPLPLLAAGLFAAGSLSMAWNGLSFAAAAELVGRARSGAAIGFQQTVLSLSGAVVPPVFAAVAAAFSWRVAFAAVAAFPLAGWWALGPLAERPAEPARSS